MKMRYGSVQQTTTRRRTQERIPTLEHSENAIFSLSHAKQFQELSRYSYL